MVIIAFFVGHWVSSIFCQTFFLHRYGAHRQFTMTKPVERAFHLLTYLTQGASFLSARGYAILHRMHHAYSDGPKDPHSPLNHSNFFAMMWATKKRYDCFAYRREEPETRFAKMTPDWPALDRWSQSWVTRIGWLAAYTAFYAVFATQWWMWLLLPTHFLMGPIHGAIVNWCGHRYGYRNYESDDVSRNTLVFDFVTWGELFQNNHHRHPMRPNFGVRWFEIDPTWQVMRLLAFFRVIELRGFREIDDESLAPTP
jgi:stearoyl-CoA desaturase (Delta-9 desaturase)